MDNSKNSNAAVSRIVLCSKDCCCPVVEVYDDKILIIDDYGGKVVLTKEEWKEAISKVKVD